MPNSPTIVSAALSDKELQASINQMVANFDKGLQTMLEHSNEYVGKIQESLQKIGNTNFGAKGSNDGGIAKQTKAQNEFTDVVKKSTNEIKKQNQEAAMSFDQIAAAQQKAVQSQGDSTLKKSFNRQELQQYIDRLRELQAEYIKVNTQEGAGAKSDKIKADMRNLEELIAKYKEILRNLDYVNSRQGTIDVKKWVQDLGAVDDRYKKLTRWYTVLEKEDQRRIVSEEKANQRRLADLEKEKAAQDKVIKSYQDSVLKAEFGKVMKMPTTNIDEIRAKFERLSTIIANIRELGILSPEKISAADSEVKKLGASIQRYEKFEQERIAAEQKFIVEQAKEIEQTQTLEGRVKGLAQAAREYLQANNENRWSTSAYGKGLTIYAENDARAKGLSIEEQIARQFQAEEVLIAQQVSAAQQLNSERKKYVAPTAYDIRDTANNVIANKLGIKSNQVVNANIYSDSIRRVSAEYKQLQDTIAKMSTCERNSPIGRYMIQRMQELERQTQRTRAELSRPISFQAAKGLSEATLDDMAYKLRQLQSYKMGLNVKTQINEMKEVDKEIVNLKKRYDELMGKNQQMIASNNALGRSWNYMKNRLAFYFTVGASTQFVKQLIDIRGQYELLDRSIGILIDSAQNGSQIFAELNAMAIKSPFTTMELGAAAKQLVAYDVAAKDVVDTTRRLADMAAAVGIPIERLTYALGQIKAYGYLNARDARMFANAGIPLVKELADYYTELEGRLVSTADVYDRIKKKAIDYNDVMNVVNKMTDEGGKFFDFQEKAADTLKVRIANLTLAWNNMLNEMGKDNQGILTEGLKVTKQIFESWRDINNMVIALGFTYGTIKAAQIAYYLWVMRTEKAVGAWSKIINAIDYAFNAKIANAINSLKTSLVGFFTNPAAMLAVAFTALSVALTKAYLDYRDLQAANEEFNKSVVKNAEENVKSIDKFFGDYKKQLESVGSLNSADQTKLWERVQEEIEKTTKNAEKYIEILNKIPEISKRIEMGEEVLEQSKRIQDELKRMAERGEFNIGGGFANDSAAKDLQQYSDIVNELIRKYGTLDEAKKEALKVNEITLESGEVIKQYTGEYADFQRAQIEAEKELQNIVSTLDKVNIAEILGTGDMETQLANVRSFAIAWRDAFLATEKGSKISAEGQALLNSYIDKWIEQQARVNHLIKDENAAAVEANRTAWETFFKFLNTEERKRLDVAIKTNQLRSTAVQELWDEASKRMQKNATTSYNLIQQQIADLRNTPDIVINVVYRNNKEKLDKDQEEFEKKYIQPKDWGVLSTDKYLEQEKANREKFGTLMRKQGEDTVEYEKRISDERKNNLELQKKNGDIIEENKNKTDAFSRAVTEQAKKEKDAADDRLKVIKEVEDAGGYDFSTKGERAAAKKAAKQAESELQKALKEELSTIDKVRSIYKDLTKEGMSHANAVERATRGWDETINAINRVLKKNGLQKLDLSKFAGIENPRELVNMLQSQLNTLLKRGAKPAEIKELQTKVNTLEVDADKYDLTKITKGLNNELGKLKDEYELAVELDADPELGNVFANMIGIDIESLPHTVKEYADQYSKYLNKYLKGKNSSLQFTGDELRGLTRDDITAFREQVDTGSFNQEWFDAILKAYEDISGKRKKDLEETEKWKNSLIEKYGNLQDKLTKIYKDSVQNQVNAVKTFGTEGQKSDIVRLQLRLEATDDPAELANINLQIAEIVKDVTDKNPIALKVVTSSKNQEEIDTSKAYWEDFKNSELYAMTFEDMANNSTRAIQLIMDKLNGLKDKVKEDPASMKALIKSLEDAQKELNTRDPFGGVARSLRDMANASQEARAAQEALWRAEVDVEQAQQEVDNSEDGTPEEQAAAQQKLADAIQRRAAAQVKLTQAENKGKKAQENLKSSLQGISNQLGNVQELFGVVSKLFRAGGDNETADAIDAISEGFSIMTTVIMGVVAAMILLEASQPWLLAIAAALGVIVGLAKWLSGNDNEEIDNAVKESERAVKRLEIAYKDLEDAVNNAYGASISGAKRAAFANKELQLVEIKRQIQLEKSRDSKDRDEDKILDLQAQYKDLLLEIKNGVTDIVNEMLGISSVGDGITSIVEAMIDAFRNGENAMDAFSKKWDEMIDSMILKLIVSEYMQKAWDNVMATLKQKEEEFLKKSAQDKADTQAILDKYSTLQGDDAVRQYIMDRYGATDWLNFVKFADEKTKQMYRDEYQNYIDSLTTQLANAESAGEKSSEEYLKWSLDYMMGEGKEYMTKFGQNLADALGNWYTFGQDNDKQLSALQQGLQGVSEETASAVEAYLNGMSQQAYLRNDLLTQIRDTIMSFDMDVQLGVFSQMLLQLQQSYAVQMAIQGILEGTLNPSGQGFRVELIS